MKNFKTPRIPKWIRGLHCDGYRNIFELGLRNRNLFGTETLFGDWNGPLLIVAKDFAPAASIWRRAERLPPHRVYHHHDGSSDYEIGGAKTNRQLVRFAFRPVTDSELQTLLRGERNLDCGALYISASFLLKDVDDYSAGLPGWAPGRGAFEQSKEVLHFVLDNMPKLKAIACLGRDAEKLVEYAETGNLVFRYIPHPSRGSNESHYKGWDDLFTQTGLGLRGAEIVAKRVARRRTARTA
jgi:hypothetical protein